MRAGGLRVAELTLIGWRRPLSLGQTDSSCRPAGKKRRRQQHGRDVIDYVAAGGGLDSALLFIKHNLALINFKYCGLSVCITGTLCVISDKTMSRPN